jgi:hypothetical protein
MFGNVSRLSIERCENVVALDGVNKRFVRILTLRELNIKCFSCLENIRDVTIFGTNISDHDFIYLRYAYRVRLHRCHNVTSLVHLDNVVFLMMKFCRKLASLGNLHHISNIFIFKCPIISENHAAGKYDEVKKRTVSFVVQ